MTSPLLLLLLLGAAPATAGAAAPAAAQPNVVSSLPGWNGSLAEVYAGHAPIDGAAGERQLFYWLFGSTSPTAATDPVVVWFQGGGGASPPWGTQTGPFAFGNFAGGGASTFGLFNELGPFLPPDNATGEWLLSPNPNSWGDRATLLFIDQPVGVGLSYFTRAGGYAADMGAVGADAHAALRRILLTNHPQYAARDLYLFGESYAGHYVPAIASDILANPGGGGEGRLKLVGLGLGDVCPGEENTLALPELLHGLGYADDAQVAQLAAMRSRCLGDMAAGRRGHAAWSAGGAAFKSCEGIEIAKNLVSGGIHDQDSRRYATYPSLADLVNVDDATQEDSKATDTNLWLDLPATRAALNDRRPAAQQRSMFANQPNTTRGMWLANDNVRTTLPLWPRLVSSLRVLVYNGNFDVSCNHLGTERSMSRLGHFEAGWAGGATGASYTAAYGATERRFFTIGGQMAGYWRHVTLPAGSLTLAVGQGGGHLYPHDQPRRMHVLLDRFLRNGSRTDASALCDQPAGVCRASDVAAASLGGRCALLYNCSGHGACSEEAACRCGRGWSGVDCSVETVALSATRTKAATVAAPTSWALFALPAPADDAAASVVVRAGANASGASLFLATHGALPSAAAGSYNVSWRLPSAGAALRLDVGAALAPFWGGSAAARDASLPWTLGVLNALDGSDAPNLLATVELLL